MTPRDRETSVPSYAALGCSAALVLSLLMGCRDERSGTRSAPSVTAPPPGDALPGPPRSVRQGTSASSCAAPYARGPRTLEGTAHVGVLGDIVVADVDADGFLDIVVANGNDVSEGHLHVMFGPFVGPNGTPSSTWSSTTSANYRRLAVGDIDNDGDLDIVVAIQPRSSLTSDVCKGHALAVPETPFTLDRMKELDCDGRSVPGPAEPGVDGWLVERARSASDDRPAVVAVFRSTGKNARDLGPTPSQSFVIHQNGNVDNPRALKRSPVGAVSVDLGDVDGDGKLDLAVALMSGGANYAFPAQILKNGGHGSFVGGQGSWRTEQNLFAYSVRFLDWDGDGQVDLLATVRHGEQWAFVYDLRLDGRLRAVPSETRSLDTFLACSSVVGSDFLPGKESSASIAAAVNTKETRDDAGVPAALVRTTGSLVFDVHSRPLTSGVRFADLDGDDRVDLVIPQWTRSTQGEGVGPGPVVCASDVLASTTQPATCERCSELPNGNFLSMGVAVGDLDNSALDDARLELPAGGSTALRHVVTISDPNVQSITDVVIGEKHLPRDEYVASPQSRLIFVRGGYAPTQTVTVSYRRTQSPDVVVGNARSCSEPISVFFHDP